MRYWFIWIIIMAQGTCANHAANLLELGPVICGSTEDLIAFFRLKILLARTQDCSSCNIAMRPRRRRDVTDGLVWRCPQCKTIKSIKRGQFLHKVEVVTAEVAHPLALLGKAVSCLRMQVRMLRTVLVTFTGGWGRYEIGGPSVINESLWA